MNKKEHLIRTLCLPYCCYYKPGKNEELQCRGAAVVERLMRAGIQLPADQRCPKAPDRSTTELMLRLLCRACEFREHDCDFAEDGKSDPCGGFVFLAKLLASGAITVEDFEGK
jgi:hypothetical protein